MNRAQRRQLVQTNDKLYTENEVILIRNRARREALALAADAYSAVVTLAIRDQLDFGKKRTQRLLAKIKDIFEDLDKGIITIEDIKKTVEEEVGVIIT